MPNGNRSCCARFGGAGVVVSAFAIASCILACMANGDTLPLGQAADYAVLYTGGGGNQLSISNVTVNGNVGVGGIGTVHFSGPGTIAGRLDFSATNTGQYSNSNGSNVGPTSVNYGVSEVTSALNTINSLSTSVGGSMGTFGTAITFNNSNQTVNESSGALETVNGVTFRVFDVTSYSENNGDVVTINGDGSGDPVALNFGFNNNVNLGGDVVLNGLVPDQVLWNFTSSGQNIGLNNNASSYPLPDAFMGDILAPNDAISLVNANLDGRVLGGDSQNMQIVSGDTINAPAMMTSVPLPTPVMTGGVLMGLFGLSTRRLRAAKRLS